MARAIHESGRRDSKPFIKINRAALPETLLENELFGHEKGAFTGAHTARSGRFELAKGGTISLDEIAEMPLSLQAKMLRIRRKSNARNEKDLKITSDLLDYLIDYFWA